MGSIFSGIKDAEPSRGGLYFRPGTYEVKILKCSQLKTRKREDAFLVETEVLVSDNLDIKKGMRPSWMVMIREDTSALGNIKSFIAAATGEDEDEIDEEVGDYVISAKQPLAGKIMRAMAVNVATRAGGTFTKVEWELITD